MNEHAQYSNEKAAAVAIASRRSQCRDSQQRRSVARQVVLGPATPPPVADLGATCIVLARVR